MKDLSYCPNFIGYAINIERTKVIRLRCKMWSCPYCKKINARQHGYRVYKAIQEESVVLFGTLTLPPDYHSPGKQGDGAKKFRDDFPKFMRVFKKKHKVKHWYRCYELHKDGTFHLHFVFVMSSQVKTRKVTRSQGDVYYHNSTVYMTWHKKLKNGGIHDCRPLESGKVSNYVAKYTSKGDSDMPKGTRRVQYSKGFPDVKLEPGDGWEYRSVITTDDVLGSDLYDVNRGHVLTLDDFFDKHGVFRDILDFEQADASPFNDDTII